MNEDFKKWACSYSGFDGGNPAGKYWFCGIEPGGNFNESDGGFNFEPVLEMPEAPEDYFSNSSFNKNVAKLHAVIIDENIEKYKDLKPFKKDSNSLKLNLYPINFNSHNDLRWDKRYYQLTGFPTKESYRGWCQQYRFPIFLELMESHLPNLIVGMGSGYLEYFILAFGGTSVLFSSRDKIVEEKIIDKTKLRYLCFEKKGKEILLVITPFLGGPKGLQSDDKIQRAGEIIRELLNEKK